MNISGKMKLTGGGRIISSNDSDWIIIRWMLILRPAVVTATLGAAMLIYPGDVINKVTLAIIVFGTYILSVLYRMAHQFSGIHRLLLGIQISFDIFIITGIIHYTGGPESPFVVLYFLSIMCASLFFRRLLSFLIATQSAVFYISYIGIYIYTNNDVVPYNITLQTIIYSVFMYAVSLFSSHYAESVYKKDTALLSALKLLKEARLDTSDIIQSMSNGLITVNMNGLIVYLNKAAEKILQIKRINAIGRKYRDVFGARAPELVDIIDNEIVSVSGGAEREITVSTPEGKQLPLGLTSVPLYDTDKSRRGVIINFKDLTEKNKLIEMVRQSDRMAAIGELSAAIAHEIRNPLASICNAAELLKESYVDNDEQIMNLINIIENETERLHRISTEFLGFTREKKPNKQRLDLYTTTNEIIKLLENDPRYTDRITITNSITENTYVLFDEDHLIQLIMNIFINSLEELNGEGKIIVEIEDGGRLNTRTARLKIYATGKGFPEEALGHMFEPFFSMKDEGTGLGLALVRKLIIVNNGQVFARNKDGYGAEIVLDIPLNGEV